MRDEGLRWLERRAQENPTDPDFADALERGRALRGEPEPSPLRRELLADLAGALVRRRATCPLVFPLLEANPPVYPLSDLEGLAAETERRVRNRLLFAFYYGFEQGQRPRLSNLAGVVTALHLDSRRLYATIEANASNTGHAFEHALRTLNDAVTIAYVTRVRAVDPSAQFSPDRATGPEQLEAIEFAAFENPPADWSGFFRTTYGAPMPDRRPASFFDSSLGEPYP